MPLPGRPRSAGGTETRFRGRGQSGVDDPSSRFRTGPRDRFRARPHLVVTQPGRSPGTQDIDIGADRAAPGTIRRLFKQAIDYIPPPAPVSWTMNEPLTITRALRYKASSVFRGYGSSNTRFGAPRALRPPMSGRHPARVTLAAGNLQGRPVLRNRLSSFGSRVKPVNG